LKNTCDNEVVSDFISKLRCSIQQDEILSCIWGRLIYSYKFGNDYQPAIIIEAIDYSQKLKWDKKLSVENQKELNRLISDGHQFVDAGRIYEANFEINNVRNTQLYRTVLHESSQACN
jgi:predicted GNAT family N-acyltransferase